MKTIHVNNSVRICDLLQKNQPLGEFTLRGSKVQCFVHISERTHYARALIANESVGLYLLIWNS